METSKKKIIVVSLCAAIAGACVVWSSQQDPLGALLGLSSPSDARAAGASQAEGDDWQAPVAPVLTETKNNLHSAQASATPKLWPEHASLEPEERERFDAAAKQMSRITKWGRIEDAELHDFRQTLWELSERGVAEYGREIAELSAESIRDGKTPSSEVLEHVSTLDFLAKNKRPAALKVVADLAKRPLAPASSKGTPRVQRFVTLQVFDTWSAHDPDGARAFVATMPEKDRAPYVYHYYIGRQLAGVEQSARLADVSESFGAEYIAQLKLDE